MRLVLAALPLLVAAMSLPPSAALMNWPDLTGRSHPTGGRTIAYGDDPLQVGDLWLPTTGKGPFPVVVMVHGGCWQTSVADRRLMDWAANDLRTHGIAVWNIEYRGVDRTGGGYPGTFTDVAKAADQLAVIAPEYRLDLGHVVAVGHSAGGHLALWLAGRARLPANSPLHTAHPLRIDRVVSLGGLPDLAATAASPDNGCGTEVVSKLVGQRPDPYRDTSVARLLPLGVPQDLVNGREDRIIPLRLATDYVAKAGAAGDHVALHVVPGTGHVELIAPETPAWAATRRIVLAALASPRH